MRVGGKDTTVKFLSKGFGRKGNPDKGENYSFIL